jgi:hypothetical protein
MLDEVGNGAPAFDPLDLNRPYSTDLCDVRRRADFAHAGV